MEVATWIFLSFLTIFGFTTIPVAVLFSAFNSVIFALTGRIILWIPTFCAGPVFWLGVGAVWSWAFSESFPVILAVLVAALQACYIWLRFDKLVLPGKLTAFSALCSIPFVFLIGVMDYGLNYV